MSQVSVNPRRGSEKKGADTLTEVKPIINLRIKKEHMLSLS